jgi:predicted amino acid-binding ACT domain protein
MIPYSMRQFLIAIQGQNRTGIVAEATGLLYRHGVNITDSFMTTLRSEFTMMMIVQLPEGLDFQTFENDLNALGNQALGVFLRPLLPSETLHGNAESVPNYSLSVLGRDQAGMIFKFSQRLAQQKVNITDVNTRLLDGSQPPLYAMIMETYVPPNLDLVALKQALQAVAAEMGVDAHFHPLEQLEI